MQNSFLERTKELMDIRDVDIKLDFFSDSPIEMTDGTILTTPADMDGSWQSVAGTFEQNKDVTTQKSSFLNSNNFTRICPSNFIGRK